MEARASCQLNTTSSIYWCLGPGLANFGKAPEKNDSDFMGLSIKAEKQPGKYAHSPAPAAGKRPNNTLKKKKKNEHAESPCNFTSGS